MNPERQKIYVSPSAKKGVGYPNGYFIQLKKCLSTYYDVLEADDRPCLMQGTAMLRNAFKADIFLLSFVETMAFQKLAPVQCLMARIALWIMRRRGGRIVFIFHNIHPHKGENRLSRSLTSALMKRSCLILSHSEEACEYARKYLKDRGMNPDKVIFRPHPLRLDLSNIPDELEREPVDDVLVWGDILPYKGVAEFLSNPVIRDSGLRMKVVGKCADAALAARIGKAVSSFPEGTVTFRNERPGFEKVASMVRSSRFVLFPYLPGGISSSGVLMDTIAMGGTPVGPDAGAFRDLASKGLCLVYHSDEEMMDILRSDRSIDLASAREFLYANSWPAFAAFLHGVIPSATTSA